MRHNCDLCGADKPLPIPHTPMHVCSDCGLVYVVERRSAQEIADEWTNNVFGEGYTAAWPAVQARHEYVAAFMEEQGVTGRTLLDIGAGEGHFLKRMRNRGWEVAGLDPSPQNCISLRMSGIPAIQGTAETATLDQQFDVVTILWTLENTTEPRKMLEFARKAVKPDGRIVVATGSRICVPFKKRLSEYLGKQAPDCHPTHWSAWTLMNALLAANFAPVYKNRFEDTDWLVEVFMPGNITVNEFECEDPQKVLAHFAKWHETFP